MGCFRNFRAQLTLSATGLSLALADGQCPPLGSEPLGAAVVSCPLSSVQGLTMGCGGAPQGQHPACWQLSRGHCCASGQGWRASLAELIVSCHVTGNSQSYCTKLLKQPTECIHIESGRVIFRHQHSWNKQSQRQRRNYQLKQEIWACKPLCLCESYPVPEGNRDAEMAEGLLPAVHPEKPQDVSETVELGFPCQ